VREFEQQLELRRQLDLGRQRSDLRCKHLRQYLFLFMFEPG
jgi:hypothetical protein